ncbi:MAG: RNA polymerase subunit sigma [Gemmataceae bacterium]|nr:RNA polymerase subunit sigma [Gemmataceae bacterium]
MSEVTRFHDAPPSGDHQAAAGLFPLVYGELRTLAAAKMAAEAPGHTLDATALVHDAWIKLRGQTFTSRSAYLRAAAVAMRRLLVDHARAKKAAKRGGVNARADLDPDQLPGLGANPDVEALDAALAEFAAVDPQGAELVQLRYFVGLSNADAALTLGISPRTADRIWVYAKAWLFARLSHSFLA